MTSLRCVLMIALILGTSGCSSLSVNTDFDSSAPFASYKTYAWLNTPPATDPAGGAQAAQSNNSFVHQRVTSAVDAQLKAKGMTLVSGDPDLNVAYHTGMQNKVDVSDMGYGYGMWGGGGLDVYSYTEGTLIIDLVDAKKKELAWRGTATDVASGSPSAEKINTVVAEMFAKYPPKPAGS